MKKYVLCLTLFVLTLLASGCEEEAPKETKILLLAETHSADHITTEADMEFARLVEEKSEGTLKIDVRTDGELGSETEVMSAIYNGELDLARVSMSSAGNESDIPGKVELPYLFRDRGHMWRSVEKFVGPALDLALSNHNAKIVTYLDSGARNLYTKNVINTEDDLKGLRIRTYTVSKLSSDYLSMLGINPTPLDFNEILSSLESNTIDGAENNIVSYYTSGHYKYAKNLLKIEYRRIPDMIVMNRSVYDSLTPSQQDIIDSAAKEVSIHQRENWENYELEIEEKLKAEGCNIMTPSEELDKYLRDTSNIVYRHLPYENAEVTLIEQIRATK